ncbi:MAG: hypothetical protein J6R26_08705 [Paludibacteraceae bacterium]|nr:hypothetical protein [Paludibacteraceae bacterium]
MKKIVVLLILCILSFPFFATDVLPCGSDTVSLVVEPDEEQLRQQCDSLEIARERLKREEEAREKLKKANSLVGELFGHSENGIAFTNPPEVTMPVRRCLKFVKPKGNFPQSGEVVLKITVDEEGNVVALGLGPGTTISDQQTINAAKKAAMATKFSPGETATGTITYIFM